jgi:hypothetical protein
MKKTLTIGLSALALTMTGAAFAQQADGTKAPKPDMTRVQAQTKADEMFAKMDANNDGAITQADREARRQAMRTKMFDALDTDKNGQISRNEFMAKHDMKKGQMGKHDRGDKRGKWGKHDRGGMQGMADTNKDGSISKAEFTAAALARFDKNDANKDGTVTAEERKAAREAMRAQWQAKKAEKAN